MAKCCGVRNTSNSWMTKGWHSEAWCRISRPTYSMNGCAHGGLGAQREGGRVGAGSGSWSICGVACAEHAQQAAFAPSQVAVLHVLGNASTWRRQHAN